MKSPLRTPIHQPPIDGRFGAVRQYDIHTGVDLYAEPGTKVYAMEPGSVVTVEAFTGMMADSPWWLDTKAVMVKGESGIILYGEIDPMVSVGDHVFEGDLIGTVLRVLKKDKGKPVSMLHLELYTPDTTTSVWWKLGESKSDNLLDPTTLLEPFYVSE